MFARPERERPFDGYIFWFEGKKREESTGKRRGQESTHHARRGANRVGLDTAGRPAQHQRQFVVGLAQVSPCPFSLLQAINRLSQQDQMTSTTTTYEGGLVRPELFFTEKQEAKTKKETERRSPSLLHNAAP